MKRLLVVTAVLVLALVLLMMLSAFNSSPSEKWIPGTPTSGTPTPSTPTPTPTSGSSFKWTPHTLASDTSESDSIMENWWFSGLALGIYSLIYIGIILAWAEIFIKAGQNRWLCFLIAIPVVNLIVFFWFAYSKWPIHEGLRKDWKLKILEDKKVKLETEIESLKPTQKSPPKKKNER